MELHGGLIAASSPGLDQGATFIVQLPEVQQPHVDDVDFPADDRDTFVEPPGALNMKSAIS